MSTRSRRLQSTHEAASEASSLILEVAAEWGLPEEMSEQMLLVVGEAVANAAEHGNGLDPERIVILDVIHDGQEVTICVEDEGPGLDPARFAAARLPEDPLVTEGRGLYIIRELAHRVWLENDGRRMCVAWRAPAGRS